MDLQQANALLLAKRAALGIVPKLSAVTAVSLPLPVSFQQQALNLIEQARTRDGLKPQEKRIIPCDTFLAPPAAVDPAPVKPTAVTVKNYPFLGLAILKAKLTAVYRVWLVARHVDRDGRGWLETKELETAVTGGQFDLFNYRRFRQIVGDGCGTFWQEANGRLWLAGVAQVAIALGCSRVDKPVELPLTAVTGSLKGFNASLYAAWDTRRKPAPVSRSTREDVTGVPERTQRHYCQVAGIRRVRNYSLASPTDEQGYAYQHGTAVFSFRDHKGKNGRKGRSYTARELPTTQQPSQERANVGRYQKINQKINLVIKASRVKVERLFFENARQASKKASRGGESFWKFREASTFNLWSHFFYS